MAQGYVPKDIVNDDNGWSIELLGKNLAAKRQKFPLFDPNANRLRADFAVKKDKYIIGTLG